MFTRKPKEDTGLEKEIARLLSDLENEGAETKEYAAISAQLERLYKLKDVDKTPAVNPDTLAIIGGNTLLAIIVVTAEKHTLISKHLTTFFTKAFK